jgi:thiamine pyrophosphate-dependent acetolactate synthase large subunit-like protein
MATASATYIGDIVGDGSTQMFTWALTTANSDGAPLEWASFSDRTFMAVGTWGGATMTVEGSNDGTNWVPLSDAAGATDATAAANKAITVVELTRYVRPNLTTPGTGAVVTASIVMRRATPLRT